MALEPQVSCNLSYYTASARGLPEAGGGVLLGGDYRKLSHIQKERLSSVKPTILPDFGTGGFCQLWYNLKS